MDSPPADSRPPSLVLVELRILAAGVVRLLWWWPGIVVVVAVYFAVAIGLFHHLYPNLWGGLAAVVAAGAWYGSPMRKIEARRRARARAG